MTPERFLNLIEIYGAEPNHWPREDRAEAETLARSGDATVAEALKRARELDGQLSDFFVQAADEDLVRRILASAPMPPWWRVSRRRRLWLSGAVLAGAGMSGIAAGAIGLSLLTPMAVVGTSLAGDGNESSVDTVFGEVRVNWGER
jgi:hypothetical protein